MIINVTESGPKNIIFKSSNSSNNKNIYYKYLSYILLNFLRFWNKKYSMTIFYILKKNKVTIEYYR